MDSVCNRGFTFTFYMHNHPELKESLNTGIFSLHSRVFALFDTFKDKYHKVNFNNMYSSAKFPFATYVKHKKTLKTQGIF